jgi:hypothetical protein
LLTIPEQPKENAARTNNAKTKLINFFTPLHLLSFGRCLPQIHNTIEETSLLHTATSGDLKDSLLIINKTNKIPFFSQGKNLGNKKLVPFSCRRIPTAKPPAKRLLFPAFDVIRGNEGNGRSGSTLGGNEDEIQADHEIYNRLGLRQYLLAAKH